MYCTKCGTKNSGRGLFCKNCGASLVEEALYEEQYDETIPEKESSYQEKDQVIKNKVKNNNKSVNKSKPSKSKNSKDSSSEKTVVHKTSPFQKFMVFLLVLIIIILLGGLIAAGLYIFQDKTVEVPDVVGMEKDQATLLLTNNDLRVKIKEEEVEEESKNNIVLKQSKEAGEFVAKNYRIILTIGVYNSEKLDNYVGLSLEKAEKLLKSNNIDYEITEIESDKEDGVVISQTPSAGSDYDEKTTVQLTVSKQKKIEKQEESVEEIEQLLDE